MSAYLLSWILLIAAVLSALAAVIAQNSWLFVFAFALLVLRLVSPRCSNCRLPVGWQKRPDDPDYFIYYLGNLPFWPRSVCARCEQDLTS